MRSILFLLLSAIGYFFYIYLCHRKIKTIAATPWKYKTIEGFERYKKSIWYQRKVARYGIHYYASLILFIPLLPLLLLLYDELGVLLQTYLLIPVGAYRLSSVGLMVGAIGTSAYEALEPTLDEEYRLLATTPSYDKNHSIHPITISQIPIYRSVERFGI